MSRELTTPLIRTLSRVAVLLCAGLAAGCGSSAATEEGERYVVLASSGRDLALPRPRLPDLSPYTRAAVEARIPRGPTGQVTVNRMVGDARLHEFVAGGRLGEWARRQATNPLAIRLEGGYFTPADLARRLPPQQFEETRPGVYIARLPILIAQDAVLHIGPETRDFRLSEEHGAFLVNDGALFLVGSRLTAWREAAQEPAWFRSPDRFRPFLVSWGGSDTYISDSTVTSLGYAESKSYGVSLSQYSPAVAPRMARPRPRGWILNSVFDDLWYGLYTYEADDIVIVGNTYRNNILYGIDPHDRSRRLIIARNTVYGTRQKHGIIVSREVNDSWIFWNRSFRNKLSGIVIDRSSVGNVVAQNETYNNGADGITIYESPNNLIWDNRSIGNERHGIRLRNSVDIRLYDNTCAGNNLTGIYGHLKDLRGTDRDLDLDPFELQFSMVVVGGRLVFNGSGPVAIDRPLSVELYNVEMLAPTKKAGIQMRGVLGQHQHEILDILFRQGGAAIIRPAADLSRQER